MQHREASSELDIPISASRADQRRPFFEHHHRSPWAAIACMGVVFGDIGTSPLYTLNVAAKAASPGGSVAPEAAVGIVSLIFAFMHRNAQRPAAYFGIPGRRSWRSASSSRSD